MIKGVCHRVGLFLLYCLPCLISIIVLFGLNYKRSRDVIDTLTEQVNSIREESKAEEQAAEEGDIARQFGEFLQKEKKEGRLGNLLKLREPSYWSWFPWSGNAVTEIEDTVNRTFVENWGFILALAWLPFGVMGAGFARRALQAASLQTYRGAMSGFFTKYMVGFVITLGWLYIFNPYGQGASLVREFLKYRSIISDSTAPIYIEGPGRMGPVLAGFLGWYLHLLGYFFYRMYNEDVVGCRVYGVLFRKFLFVYGAALIFPSTDKLNPFFFLMGFFPLSAVSMLKEMGQVKIKSADNASASLSILPGISRREIIRLEEEGIESIPSLAVSDAAHLKTIPSIARLIDLWIDMARLMAVVGTEKYGQVKDICKTASEFLAKVNDESFRAWLEKECRICNPDEVAAILKNRFAT